mmetsp:Transcript_18016/g.57622  ORF Transcript_18016/g.57622 Transcript_18016/m.57622 type:complete len:812 (+) Transcript_18016:860-3295(+)
MRATAELHRQRAPRLILRIIHHGLHLVAHSHHPHGVRVLLPKDGAQRVDALRLRQRHHLGVHGQRALDLVVHDGLHSAQLVLGQRLAVVEVEPQPVLAHLRPLLVHSRPQHLAQRKVEHVRHGVVGRDQLPPLVVHAALDRVAHRQPPLRQLPHVQHEAAVRLHVQHLERGAAAHRLQRARVGRLPAGLGVEGGAVQHHAHHLVRARLHAVHEARRRVQRAHLGLRVLVPHVLGLRVRRLHRRRRQVRRLLRLHHQLRARALEPRRLLRPLLGLRHGHLVAVHVHRHAPLLGHDLRQVHREAHRVVQEEGQAARHHRPALRRQRVRLLVEVPDALGQRPPERRLLVRQHLHHERLLAHQLREHVAKVLHHHRHQRVEEALGRAQLLLAVPHRTTQDAPQHVAAPVVRRHRAVRDGERQRADVVRHHTVRHVHAVRVLRAHAPLVRGRARRAADGREDGLEHVRVVVAHLALQHRRQALEPHARVHVLGRQRPQRAARLAVELDEHQVPDLEHVRVVHVDQVRRVAPADAVVVDLRARPARARVAHLPEVVLPVERQHPLRRQELQPQLARLLVRRQPIRLVAAKVGRIQPLLFQTIHVGQQVPRPRDRLALEVVPERPVAQHLEERVVVHVLAHVVQVVVLAASADALLRVARATKPSQRTARVHLAQEDGLELVHASVREQQRRVLQRHHRRGSHERVLAAVGEVVNVRLPDALRVPLPTPRLHARRRPGHVGHAEHAVQRGQRVLLLQTAVLRHRGSRIRAEVRRPLDERAVRLTDATQLDRVHPRREVSRRLRADHLPGHHVLQLRQL